MSVTLSCIFSHDDGGIMVLLRYISACGGMPSAVRLVCIGVHKGRVGGSCHIWRTGALASL